MTIYEYIQASIDHAERCEDAIAVIPGRDGCAPVFAAIDGMGGHQHEAADGTMVTGREAAQKVREVLIEDLSNIPADADASPGGTVETKVVEALKRANQQVFQVLNGDGDLPPYQCVGAVATVVVVCENGKRLLAAQVGDTRGYLFTSGELIQLCSDEDNVEFLVRQNIISPEDAEKVTMVMNTFDGINEPDVEGTITINDQPFELYLAWRWFWVGNSALSIPGANVVMNALGIFNEDPIAQTSRIEISQGDSLLLCSDGIYKNLSEAELIAGLESNDDPAVKLGEKALDRSQDQGNRRRTPDDISAIVVRL